MIDLTSLLKVEQSKKLFHVIISIYSK